MNNVSRRERRRDRTSQAADCLRVVLYVRVSRAREGMESPEIQLISMRAWAAWHGHTIVAEIVDPDATGRNFNRQIQDAIALIENGSADAICVYKFSRFGRDMAGFQVNLGRIVKAGGDLYSSTEEVDATTSAGMLSRDMLAAIAAFESNRFADQWKDAQDLRLERGLPHTATPRFGYRHHKCGSQPVTSAGWRIVHAKDPACRTDGTCREEYRVDPVTGPVLAYLYRRYINGEGLATLAAWCNSTGQPRDRGGKWYPSSVADVLDSGFGAGYLRIGVSGTKGRPDKDERIEYKDGAHEPVIGPEEWERYLARRVGLKSTASSLKRTSWPLTGLIKCGRCGGNLTCAGSARGAGYIYRCTSMQNLKRCPGVWRTRAAIEQAMFEELGKVADELANRARAMGPTVRRQKAIAKKGRSRAEQELAKVDAAKKRLVQQVILGTMTDADIAEAMQDLKAKTSGLREELVAAAEPPRVVNAVAIRSLKEDWPVLPVEVARSMSRLLVREIICHPDKRIEVHLSPVLTAVHRPAHLPPTPLSLQ